MLFEAKGWLNSIRTRGRLTSLGVLRQGFSSTLINQMRMYSVYNGASRTSSACPLVLYIIILASIMAKQNPRSRLLPKKDGERVIDYLEDAFCYFHNIKGQAKKDLKIKERQRENPFSTQVDDDSKKLLPDGNSVSYSSVYNLHKRSGDRDFYTILLTAIYNIAVFYNEKEIKGTKPPLGEKKLTFLFDKLIGEKKASKNLVNPRIKPFLEEINEHLGNYEYDKAEKIYHKAIKISIREKDSYGKARLDLKYSHILKDKYFDFKKADNKLMRCLQEFKKKEAVEDTINTKRLLTQTKIHLRDYISAEIFASDVLESSENDKEKADAYVFIGSILISKNSMEKAIDALDKAIYFGTKLINSTEEKLIEQGNEIITFCYHNKSYILKIKGELEASNTLALKAVAGMRNLSDRKKLGQSLFEIAELEILQGNFNDKEWHEYLKESQIIFAEIRDHKWLAKCYDFEARVAFTMKKKTLALNIFSLGYEEIVKTNDLNGIGYFMIRFVSLFVEQNQISEAQEYLEQLIQFVNEHDIKHYWTDIYKYKVEIARLEGNKVDEDEYLKKLLLSYKQDFSNAKTEIAKLHLRGLIASIYEQQNELYRALNIFNKVAKGYEKLNVVDEQARAMLVAIQIKVKLGQKKGVDKAWKKIGKMLEGTSFYELQGSVKINLGSYFLHSGELEKSKRHLEEADYLVTKYNLKYKDELQKLLEEVKDRRNLISDPKYTFEYLIRRLYQGITKNPKSYKPLLRHWFYKYQNDLFNHFKKSTGLNAVIFNDTDEELKIKVKKFNWLFDYFISVSTDELAEAKSDIVDEYPYDNFEEGEAWIFNPNGNISEKTGKGLQKSQISRINDAAMKERYRFAAYEEKENFKIILQGWGPSLPEITYIFF